MAPPLITLTTDFGTRDPYVAAMKGVLIDRCPDAQVIDLSHEIAPHDVLEGALFIAAAVPYFPAGTVHVVVIDPGVGTERRAIAMRIAGQFLLLPDNGLATLLAREHPPAEVREIVALAPPRGELSATFHGRDVFAPAAALLAGGADLAELGPAVADPVRLDLPEPRAEGDRVRGVVIHIDRFGSAVTNLRRGDLADRPRTVRAGGHILEVRRTYGDVAPGMPLALFGSAGYLEIAVNQGRADEALGLRRGDPVEVAERAA